MTGFKLDARARLAIELALTASSGERSFNHRQEEDASALGMTGAEIDMARSGSSFDFQLSKAVALALVPDDEHRECARKAGIDADACVQIETLAASYTRTHQVRNPHKPARQCLVSLQSISKQSCEMRFGIDTNGYSRSARLV
ncbi:hypothetical protein [Pararhizobium gei]|uniref:hypothetical protein n=1 Tax=Pararhizobium gei TaxID=1395951 RepID=UPI0023DAE755|nr:hypothetical protein [Rhizobium gei]